MMHMHYTIILLYHCYYFRLWAWKGIRWRWIDYNDMEGFSVATYIL
jgi:hypothetical protein